MSLESLLTCHRPEHENDEVTDASIRRFSNYARSSTDDGRSPSFYDDYEPVGGVPTRVLTPSTSLSKFTCHAYSKDGTFMATGEKNGTVSLWKTEGYACMATAKLFANAVDCMRFFAETNDRIIAVDRKGQLLDFMFVRAIRDDGSSNGTLTIETRVGQLYPVLSFKAAQGVAEHAMFQFSDDGCTLVCSRWAKSIKNNDDGETFFDLCKISQNWTPFVTIPMIESPHWISDLSGNGQSLILRNMKTKEIYVYPNAGSLVLDNKVKLPAERASWGLGGKYLLMWTAEERTSLMSGKCVRQLSLSIYSTNQLVPSWTVNRPVARRVLGHGLSICRAQILKHGDAVGRLHVLISEVASCGTRRIVIWDVSKDCITHELLMTLQPDRSVDGSTWSSCVLPVADINSGDRFRDVCFVPRHQILEDSCLKFCISEDMMWIGAVSSRLHSCAIVSVRSGVTTWGSTIPSAYLMNPVEMPNCAMFDTTGKHFMVFSDSVIFAHAPAFLNNEERSRPQFYSLEQYKSKTSGYASVVDAFRTVPSEALARATVNTWDRRSSLLGFDTNFNRHHLSYFGLYPHIVDAVLSSDCKRLVFIHSSAANRTTINIDDTVSANDERRCLPRELPDLEFPLPVDGHSDGFVPGKLFLFRNERGSENGIALFSRKTLPIMLVCDIQDSSRKEIVTLPVHCCLRYSQTEDRQRMCLLDSRAVVVYELYSRRSLWTVHYQVDFSQLVNCIDSSTKWSHWQYYPNHEITERRIADDGSAVLLAWDVSNQRSIIVKPESDQASCLKRIRSGDQALSQYCSLSSNGQCTVFLDIDCVKNGELVIGIKDSKAPMRIRKIFVEHVPWTVTASRAHFNCLLSSVYCSLSSNGSNLIVAIVQPESFVNQDEQRLQPRIQIFSLYCVQDTWMPTYDQLLAEHNIISEQQIEQFVQQYGLAALNGPPLCGMSIFHEAIKKEDQTTKKLILALAEKRGMQLAADWRDIGDREANFLDDALSTTRINRITDAVDLIGSECLPFCSAARVISKNFRELYLKYQDILENALAQNLLIRPVCQLRVHVNFMNHHKRRDTAIHIDTANTFLRWVSITDPDALEQNWELEHKSLIERMVAASRNTSTVSAQLKFVCIENAAKIGMEGIIRPLLLQNTSERFFQYDAVKWTIQYKWFKIWKPRFIRKAGAYVAFLAVFVCYASLVSYRHKRPLTANEEITQKVMINVTLAIMFLFGCDMLIEEITQIRMYYLDGIKYFNRRSIGLKYFFASRWNWVDLISCFLILVVIPFLHFNRKESAEEDFSQSTWEDAFSGVVAIESILAFVKVWYFAQPFRGTGAFVLLIYNIARDCLAFLCLAFVVTCGFSMALHVLFRRVPFPTGLSPEANHTTLAFADNRQTYSEEIKDDVYKSFRTLPESLLTLFYALLGAFEPDLYRSSGEISWMVTAVFNFYLIALMIVLLNLLIAIMGDSYDRVKSTEEAQLLMGRAVFIDACEAALNKHDRTEIGKQIGKYVRVLTHCGDEDEIHVKKEWRGKLAQIEHKCKEVTVKSEQNLKARIAEQEEKLVELVDEVALLRRDVDSSLRLMRQKEDHIEESMRTMEANIINATESMMLQLQQLTSHWKASEAEFSNQGASSQ